MKYEAIIFDIDGTAIPNAAEAVPSERMVNVIQLANSAVWLYEQ